tara:strand:+ start:498 stop:698 length:201 start_codon:yes stop_codon:yes gene_type:complete
MDIKFPKIEVTLTGTDGNAFAVIGKVMNALKRAGVSQEDRDTFMAEATSGDYNHVLQTCMSTVNTY